MGRDNKVKNQVILGSRGIQTELGTEHSHGGKGLDLIRAGLGVGMGK